MEETMKCERCGQYLPRSKLERMKTGTYRRVCNHCKWLYYVKPSRDRRILRELAARRNGWLSMLHNAMKPDLQEIVFHLPKDYLLPSKRLSFALQKTIFRKLHFGWLDRADSFGVGLISRGLRENKGGNW